MLANDLLFDGRLLSDMGYQFCSFDSSGGIDTTSLGSQIKFNVVATRGGKKHYLTHSAYEDCIEATFQICKTSCDNEPFTLTIAEGREIVRWLNRETFMLATFMDCDEDDESLSFFASFNAQKVEFDGKVIGFEITMTTDSPFSYKDKITNVVMFAKANESHSIVLDSDVEGFLYPSVEIKLKADGNLSLTNKIENRVSTIKNCKNGETITMNYPVITSSLGSHKVYVNDFNWNFFRLAQTFENNVNEIVATLPCTVTITYRPMVKFSI